MLSHDTPDRGACLLLCLLVFVNFHVFNFTISLCTWSSPWLQPGANSSTILDRLGFSAGVPRQTTFPFTLALLFQASANHPLSEQVDTNNILYGMLE